MKLPKRRFQQELKQRFSKDDIRTVCFSLGINHEELDEKNINTLTESLLLYVEKRGRIMDLVEILRSERPRVDWSALAFADVDCPYRGLLPFREEDAHLFFGRDAYTERLLEAVENDKRPLVAVIGPSGSGKSSVVFAGLVPRLRQTDQWQIIDFSPGKTPFETLSGKLIPLLEPDLSENAQLVEANAQSENLVAGKISLHQAMARIVRKMDDGKRILLIVDQFEELYTQTEDTTLQENFTKALLGLRQVEAVTVLLTMRADFLDRALAYRPFADELQAATQMVGSMDRDELIEVIERPLSGTFVTFEPGLTTQILDDVGKEPGNLPLLEFALESLWQEQVDGKLTFAVYEKIGKVEGALTKQADAAFNTYEEKDEDVLVRRLFVQLVQPVNTSVNTKRKAWRSELGDELWQLAAELADARLIVTNQDDKSGEDYIELAHEALITNWERFDGWIKEDWEFRAWQERLRSAIRVWREKDQLNGFLLQQSSLAVARDWLISRREDLSFEEIEYIDLSERKHRLDNYKRIAIGAVVVGLLIVASIAVAITQSQARIDVGIEATKGALAQETAVAAAVTAEHSENQAILSEAEAIEARATAESNETLANARWLISQGEAEYEEDPLLGLALVLEGLALVPETERVSVIGNSFERVFSLGRTLFLGNDVKGVSIIEANHLQTLHQDHSIVLWDLYQSGLGYRIDTSNILFYQEIVFDRKSKLTLIDFVTPRDLPSDIVYYLDTGEVPEVIANEYYDAQMDLTARLLIIDNKFSNDAVYDLDTMEPPDYFEASEVKQVEFIPDLRMLLVDYLKGLDYLYEIDTGERLLELKLDGSVFIENHFLIVNYEDQNTPNAIYSLSSLERLFEVSDGNVIKANVDAENQFLAIFYENGENHVYSINDGEYLFTLSQDLPLDQIIIDEEKRLLVVDYLGDSTPGAVYDINAREHLFNLIEQDIFAITADSRSELLVVTYVDDWRRSSIIYDISTGAQPNFIDDNYDDLVLDVEARLLAVSYENIPDAVYNVDTEQPPDFLENNEINSVALNSRSFHPGNTEANGMLVVDYLNSPDFVYDIDSETPIFIPDTIDLKELSTWRMEYDEKTGLMYINTDGYSGLVYDIDTLELPNYLTRDDIVQAILNSDLRLLVVDYENNPSAVYNIDTEEQLYELDIEREWLYISFDTETRLLAVEYQDSRTPDAIYDVDHGKLVEGLQIKYFSNLDYFVAVEESFQGNEATLWRTGDRKHLAQLGVGLDHFVFNEGTRQLAIRYLTGKAYIVDLAWLEAMHEANVFETAILNESIIQTQITLACQFPLKSGLPPASQERLVEILSQIYAPPVRPRACIPSS